MRWCLWLLFSLLLQGQITFAPGVAGDSFCSKPVVPCRNGAACFYTDATMTPSTMLYGFGGSPLKCSIPLALPSADLFLGFIEPNKTAAGERVFKVSVNGGNEIIVDPFQSAGLKKFFTVKFPNVSPVSGFVTVTFTAVTGNAVVSIITVSPPVLTGSPAPLPITVDPDGAVRISADVRVTGGLSTGFGSQRPTDSFVNLDDGTFINGLTGKFALGTCTLQAQAGWVVAIDCSGSAAVTAPTQDASLKVLGTSTLH